MYLGCLKRNRTMNELEELYKKTKGQLIRKILIKCALIIKTANNENDNEKLLKYIDELIRLVNVSNEILKLLKETIDNSKQ